VTLLPALTQTTTTSDDIDDRYARAARLLRRNELSLTRNSAASDPRPTKHLSTKLTTNNRQYVSRVCLVLAPAHLRQGQPRVVRTLRAGIGWEKGAKRNTGKRWAYQEQGANIALLQPCLHPQGRSRPQVRPEHLPSVLP
jgi:hypothetical protein